MRDLSETLIRNWGLLRQSKLSPTRPVSFETVGDKVRIPLENGEPSEFADRSSVCLFQRGQTFAAAFQTHDSKHMIPNT